MLEGKCFLFLAQSRNLKPPSLSDQALAKEDAPFYSRNSATLSHLEYHFDNSRFCPMPYALCPLPFPTIP